MPARESALAARAALTFAYRIITCRSPLRGSWHEDGTGPKLNNAPQIGSTNIHQLFGLQLGTSRQAGVIPKLPERTTKIDIQTPNPDPAARRCLTPQENRYVKLNMRVEWTRGRQPGGWQSDWRTAAARPYGRQPRGRQRTRSGWSLIIPEASENGRLAKDVCLSRGKGNLRALRC